MSRTESLNLRDIGLLFVGFGIGSAIGLLLAPGTGKDLRHSIDRTCRKTARSVKRGAEFLRDHAEDLVEHANDLGRRSRKLGKHGVHLVRRFRAA
jgi:gas vesicle protein